MENENQYNYDYSNTYQNPNTPPPYQPPKSNGMATASLILGILSLVLCCCVYFSIPLGALAILFAILSRGSSRQMTGQAKAGLGLGIGGIVLTFIMILFTVIMMGTASLHQAMSEYMEDYYGDYYGNYYEESIPESPRYDIGNTL